MGLPILFPKKKFTPRQLFLAGEQGAWYDPSDLSTLFTDAAGTTPVTGVEQAVGLMLDKSGRGNHAVQSTLAKRPVLRQETDGRYYLAFDGVDDHLFTGNINLTATNSVSVFAGARKMADAAEISFLLELSLALDNYNGTVGLNGNNVFVPRYFGFASRGSATVSCGMTDAGYAAPYSAVLTGLATIATDTCILRINGAQVAQTTADQGSGNFGNHPLYIGGRGATSSFFGNWRVYSLIIRGAQTPDAQIAKVETWVNSKTKAY